MFFKNIFKPAFNHCFLVFTVLIFAVFSFRDFHTHPPKKSNYTHTRLFQTNNYAKKSELSELVLIVLELVVGTLNACITEQELYYQLLKRNLTSILIQTS